MQDLNLEKFDPTVAELTKIAEESRAITITDFEDRKQIEAVRTKRIELKKTRVSIEKRGKELREDAITFQKAVIAKEKELIAIIEPEEIRLDQLEDAAKQDAIEKERLRKWPERKERLHELGYKAGVNDDTVIRMMDDVQFEAFIANAKAKIEAEALAKQRSEQAAKELELQRREAELAAKEREAKAEQEARELAAREKAEDEAREKRRAEEIERARIEGERQAKEKAEREAKEAKDAAEKLEKSRKMKAWLEERGYNEQTKHGFYIEHTPEAMILYKLVDLYRK